MCSMWSVKKVHSLVLNKSTDTNATMHGKWKWLTDKNGDPYSASDPSKVHTHTQQWTHTHTVQWAAIYAAAPGEQLGVQCFAQGHLSRSIEGEESAVHLLPPPTIPAGPRLKLTTFRLWVRLSTIRPRLPHMFYSYQITQLYSVCLGHLYMKKS